MDLVGEIRTLDPYEYKNVLYDTIWLTFAISASTIGAIGFGYNEGRTRIALLKQNGSGTAAFFFCVLASLSIVPLLLCDWSVIQAVIVRRCIRVGFGILCCFFGLSALCLAILAAIRYIWYAWMAGGGCLLIYCALAGLKMYLIVRSELIGQRREPFIFPVLLMEFEEFSPADGDDASDPQKQKQTDSDSDALF